MAGRRKSKIDVRRAVFVSEILTGKSGAAAARAAGYGPKDAAKQAHRLQSDTGVADEIERGLAAIRSDAKVTLESMVAQLDVDRLFAIKTMNASAATRASELKAKLVGLLIDRRDTRAQVMKADIALPERPTDRRQLARVVIEVLNTARLGDTFPGNSATLVQADSPPPSTSPAPVAATGDGEADASRSGTEVSPSNEPEIGERFLIGDRGASLVLIETEFGQRKYAIYDSHGELHSLKRSRDEAEALAETLPGPKS